MAQEITKSSLIPSSVENIFPLQTEVTLEISKIPEYILQIKKLFSFYNQQLLNTESAIVGYNLETEIGGLLRFEADLETAIKASNAIKPIIASEPEKTAITDYEFVTLRLIGENVLENRVFSDGSIRPVILYNRIDYVYLQNKTFSRSLAVLNTLQQPNLITSNTTLSLIFNLPVILSQINSPIPSSLLLCQGRETSLSKLEDSLSFLGVDGITSKVLLKDFINAYIHPQQKIESIPQTKPKGCTQEVRDRISTTRAQLNLLELQTAFPGFGGTPEQKRALEELKIKLIELTKVCPDLASEIVLFDSIKNFDKLGKLFTDFIQKYNLACIVDEAIKCVMPQIPCDQILRDLTVDNFEQRLQTAFPFQKNIITALSLNIKDELQKENDRRVADGLEPLDPAGQTQMVLDNINKVIDLEALCKLDINAILALLEALFNFKFPSFNILDWQFNFKIDFQMAVIEGILATLLNIIQQVLNELIGCNALDGFIAGILNSDVKAPSGLYGDLAALFDGNFDFENTKGIIGNGAQTFLTQSGAQLANIIAFESKLGNNLLGTTVVTGNLGFGTSPENIFLGSLGTRSTSLGGLITTSTDTTASFGVAGFVANPTSFTGTIDVTSFANTEEQKQFLQEIGKFVFTTDGEQTDVVRISDDSLVQLYEQTNSPSFQLATPAVIQQAESDDNIYKKYGLLDRNKHILKALVQVGESGTSRLTMTQKTLVEQLKEYIKTCFSLLSPSETINLIAGNSNAEVNITITEIARIRFPLLNAILKYPERHALLFASFGKITQLDTLGPRLQLLASAPAANQQPVDPNVCYPFTNVTDFRKALANQVLPADLANSVIDELQEDARRRANKLINDLGKKPTAADIFTSPSALSVNKTPDGKPIQEIDRIVNNTLSNVFDQIKLSFDQEIEAFPGATSAPVKTIEKVFETTTVSSTQIPGFKTTSQTTSKNQEYVDIHNILNNPLDLNGKKYYEKPVHTNQIGGLVEKVYSSIDAKADIQSEEAERLTFTISGTLATGLNQGLSEDQFRTEQFISESNANSPRWKMVYTEKTGSYVFNIKTSGQVLGNSGISQKYSQNIKVSGSATEYNKQILLNEARLSEFQVTNENLERFDLFSQLFTRSLAKITPYNSTNFSSIELAEIFKKEALVSYRDILQKQLIIKPTDSKLLSFKKVSSLQKNDPKKQNIFLGLIDFSPLQTEKQKLCGIDTHLLQLEAVKKRINAEFSSTTPENVVNNNSMINTRYQDNKPGHLSEKIMTGLIETFIRTSVIHNIFKGLFVFDKYEYDFYNFNIKELIYLFFEHTVKNDINTFKFESDIETQIEKVYNIYIKNNIISQQEDNTNKLRSIIRYHIDDVLQIIKNIVDSYAAEEAQQPSASDDSLFDLQASIDNLQRVANNGFIREASTSNIIGRNSTNTSSGDFPLQQTITVVTQPGVLTSPAFADIMSSLGMPINNEQSAVKARNTFLNNLPVIETYSNFYKKSEETLSVSTPPRPNTDPNNDTPLRSVDNTTVTVYKPDSDVFTNFTNILEGPGGFRENLREKGWHIVLERYIRTDFKQNNQINQQYRDLNRYVSTNRDTNGVVNIRNFQEIMKAIIENGRSNNNLNRAYIYSKNPAPAISEQLWMNSVPTFGLRISLVRTYTKDEQLSSLSQLRESDGFYNGIITEEYPNGITYKNEPNRIFARNYAKKNKVGLIQSFTSLDDSRNPSWKLLVSQERYLILPIIQEEVELSQDMYDFDNITLPNNEYLSDRWYWKEHVDVLFELAKRKILANPTFDLLVNYSLLDRMGRDFSLFNSLLGMASEGTFTLLNGTKELIKKNYDLHKNSGNFKTRDTTGAYEKQKQEEQNGPSPAAFLKAAAAIPINLLKGLSVAVDPNIFLADKIVLAGKMGLIQPRFRRLEAGEVVKIEGSNQTKTITADEAGVAYDGYYTYLNTGELEIKANPTRQGLAHIEYTVVALVDPQTKKIIKDSSGNVVTRKGISESGVPYDIKKKQFVNDSFDEEEEVDLFDILPSTPIYPGEKINIPYSIASLALVPFPVFSPGLTTYNVAMPFGPLFLALEHLILETPEFKASIPRIESASTNSSGNIVCDETE
jgi:hypothetical protein